LADKWEILFDTRMGRIGPEHTMTSKALAPDFKPIALAWALWRGLPICWRDEPSGLPSRD